MDPITKQWIVRNDVTCEMADDLAGAVGISSLTACLLIHRGIRDPHQALSFLSPSLKDIHDPFLLLECDTAVDRILFAMDNGQTIFVHGDYDVDGVTSAALLTRVLTKLGAKVIPFVPNRSRDGFGVQTWTVEKAHSEGADLLLTCDCGTSAIEACDRAAELGLDIVITDHHEPGSERPNALAVVNPHMKGSRYPYKNLAGVGVAYKICQALCHRRGIDLENLHNHFLDLVALGTVSDVVPLLDENRAYVFHGLKNLANSRKLGIQALIQVSGMDAARMTSEDIGFRLGPRLNAAGRLAEASEALELLITNSQKAAREIAASLSTRNRERQDQQNRIWKEALEVITLRNYQDNHVIVVEGENWNPGVIGIVAGKIAERYHRPAFVLAPVDSLYTGSARSIPGFNLAEAIDSLGKNLVEGGGHAMAAGVKIRPENLERFRERVNSLAGEWLTPEDLIPSIDIEAKIDAGDIDLQVCKEISQLAPFGEGNEEPILISEGVRLENIRCIGSDGQHLKAEISSRWGRLSVFGWGMGDLCDMLDSTRDYKICYNLKTNCFNGSEGVDLILQDAPRETQ